MDNKETSISQDELFEKEERCAKSIRTLAKALLARLLVAALLLWVILAVNRGPTVAALFALVAVMDVLGGIPLAKELKKRLGEQKKLRELEE